MIALLFKNFIRSKGTKFGLLFLFLIGIASLIVGLQFQNKQNNNIEEARKYQKEHLTRNISFHKDEMGLLLYYVKFSFVNATLPINSLSIGQRDVNPSIQSVTIRGLENQKYDAELNNPNNLLMGNIDFSFVLNHLFPLFIIAFCYTIRSEEIETGTWRIIAVQSKNPFSYIFSLFCIRVIVVLFLLTFLLFVAVTILTIPFDIALLTFYTIAVLYVLFWFSICFYVTSLQKSSSVNALLLLSIWLILMIILPTSINSFVASKYPIPEALELTLKQRKAYHEKWDLNKEETLNKFKAHYPQFKKYPLPEGEFSWLWYYAMQQMGDDEAQSELKNMSEKLQLRNRLSQTLAQFIPSLHTQMKLNEIAKSDFENQFSFLNATTQFHEKMRLYFYPKIFDNAPVENEKWDNFVVETYSDNSKINFLKSILPLLIFISVLIILGRINLKKQH